MYIIKQQQQGEKIKTNIELAKFEKLSSINLKYLKADNSFQQFVKQASDRIFFILLGDKCLREISKNFCELFQALIALTTIEFLP